MIEVLTEADGVRLVETATEHQYYLNDKKIPGCTSIIQGCGISDLSGIPRFILDKKSALGNAVHEYTHWWDENDLDLNDLKPFPDYYNRTLGWTQFREDWNYKPHATEIVLAIRVNGMTFGVKPDSLGTGNFGTNGEPWLATVEKKCTVDIEPAHEIQTAAQALALKADCPIPARIIVQLLPEPDKLGKYYHMQECKEPSDERVFLSALAIETYKRNRKIIR